MNKYLHTQDGWDGNEKTFLSKEGWELKYTSYIEGCDL